MSIQKSGMIAFANRILAPSVCAWIGDTSGIQVEDIDKLGDARFSIIRDIMIARAITPCVKGA